MKDRIIIGAICRQGEWQIAVGDTHVRAGDTVIGLCTASHLRDLQQLILA
jgi:trk system potassium uptake protein TrkA